MKKGFIRLCVLTLLSLLCYNAHSQELIHGKIILDDFEDENLKVQITNLNSGMKTISDSNEFEIYAIENDELQFESYKTFSRKVNVSKEMIEKGMTVHLNRFTINLKEIKALGLSGYLDEDINKVKEDTFAELKHSLKPTITNFDLMQMERELNIKPVTGELPIQVDLIKIISLFTRIKKQQKRNKKIEKPKTPSSLAEIRTYLGDSYFVEDLGIPINEIDIFLHYTLDKKPSLLGSNYLDVISILSESKDVYKKRNREIIE